MRELNDKDRQEIQRLGLTTEDRGHLLSAGYFCIECWAWEDELNSYDNCKSCADGVAIPVWTVRL